MIIKVEFQKQLFTHASIIREEIKGYSTEYTAENDSLFTLHCGNLSKIYF